MKWARLRKDGETRSRIERVVGGCVKSVLKECLARGVGVGTIKQIWKATQETKSLKRK